MSGCPLAFKSGDRPRIGRLSLRSDLGLFALSVLLMGPPLVLFATAADEAAPLPAQAQAIIARLDSLWLAEHRDAAHALAQAHLPAARAAGDTLFLLHLLARQGQMWATLNRAQEALPVLREALLLADTLRVEDLRRACRRWLGVALYSEGSLEDGLAQFRELLAMSREYGDVRHEGYAWMGLAYHDWRTDRAEMARTRYERAVACLRLVGDRRGELWALIGLNIAYAQLGEYAQSLAGNRRLVEVGRETGLRSVEALGHNNLGHLLYSLSDPGEALAHFEQSLRIMQAEGDQRESIVAGQNIGTCEIALGRIREAMARLGGLLDLCRRERYQDLQPGLLVELADAYLHRGLYPLAARLQREALALGEQLSINQECECLLGLSRALAAMDSSRVALELLAAAAPRILARAAPLEQCQFRVGLGRRMLEAGRHREALAVLQPVEPRSAALGLAGLRLEALVLAARAQRGAGSLDSTLAMLRRAHSVWEADRRLPLDPQWRELRGAMANELFAQLAALALEYPPATPPAERIRDAFALLQAYKARTLLERMHGPGPPAAADSVLTLTRLQSEVLEPDELFLDVLFGSEQTLLFACTRAECRAAAAPGAGVLAGKLRLYHELLSSPSAAGDADSAACAVINQVSRELAALLFAPFADLIQGRRHVILAPDGVLNLIPLAGLGLSAAQPEELLATDPLPAFSRVPAAAVLARLRSAPAPRAVPAGRILALTAPGASGEPLTGTRCETAWLAHHFAAVERRPPAVTAGADDWQPGLAPYGVLHFAMHSAMDDDSPWRSAVTLARQSSDGKPRSVPASEIADSRLPTRLVVLSSCESAKGRVLSGEGVQGLTSAFLAAGARAVVATLWPVDDAVTARFMEIFYTELARGRTAAEAVAQAQAVLRHDSLTAHPFYWAGFVLVGDGGLQLTFTPKSRSWLRWTAAALFLAALALAAAPGGRRSRSLS